MWLQRYFERFIIAFAIGVGLYFSLPGEPNLVLILSALFMAAIGGHFCSRNLENLSSIFWLVFIVLLGISRATWHTGVLDQNRLPDYERSYEVEGWIKAIEKSGPRLRWVVVPQRMSRLPTAELPKQIRVTTFDKSFNVGEGVRFRAELSAPPGPAIPGGYNPSFRAYYQEVGGYGYMVSRPEINDAQPKGWMDKMSQLVARFRYGLASRILESAPESTAGLQTALLTGIRSWIPDNQTEALRDAGLAHILAISGLHMGLIAGSIYGIVLFLLVRVERLARARDVRKFAAVIGIIAASLYLVLSGASVATQRAFIMTIIVFMALILDRQAFSIRSVAVAAFITLWLHPEALVSPGFQMSFSAVIALVIVYREWDRRRIFRTRPGLAGKMWNNFKGLTITSFVAGTATSGFAVLHFNRLAAFGLLGNVLAMPLFTFWVMPIALVVYLSMVFGLEAWPLWVMGKGIEWILIISVWVAELPGSVHYLPTGPFWVLGIFGLAFTGLCLGSRNVRLISVAAMLLCWGSLFWRTHPDIRVGDNGAIALWSEDEDAPVLYVDRKNTDSYGRQEFTEAMGFHDVAMKTYRGDLGRCDSLACQLDYKGYQILIVRDPSEILEDCHLADILIVPKRNLGARARRLCDVPVIDQSDLYRLGAHSVYLGGDGAIAIKASRNVHAQRPWQ